MRAENVDAKRERRNIKSLSSGKQIRVPGAAQNCFYARKPKGQTKRLEWRGNEKR